MGFNNLILQSKSQLGLIKSLKQVRLPKILLFYGPENTGKLSFAYNVAKALNCLTYEYDFCNNCPSCNKINSFNHPGISIVNSYISKDKMHIILKELAKDKTNKKLMLLARFYFSELAHSYFNNSTINPTIKEKIEKIKLLFISNTTKENNIDKMLREIQTISDDIQSSFKKDNISIQNIRNIISKIYIKPPEGRNRVIIINGADNMLLESANALLKIIEEPPPANTIILITRNIYRIISTIKSRSTLIHFPPISKNMLPQILQEDFGIKKEFDKANSTLWDYLLHCDFKTLLSEFLETVTPNYKSTDAIFKFTDKIASSAKSFINTLINFLKEAREIKHGLQASGINNSSNAFAYLPDKTLDSIVNEATDIVFNINTFNISPIISLSSFLIKLAKVYTIALSYKDKTKAL